MTRALAHRGPDGEGFWSDPHCALGHRRLAILDLSDAGRQPMANEDESAWISFNGEIYNFQALRRELEGLGHRFRSRTDTEVALHAWEQWGTGCLRRFRGMFAFGLWDRAERKLLLARDRVGKKPLFYTRQGVRFLFASELQGLLADPGVPREVDTEAIDAYLSWGYIPPPHTGFRGIFKLPPAHYLEVPASGEGGAGSPIPYWSLDYGPKLKLTEREAAEALREKLEEAVRLRMVSDVPLGAFLSGGVDSSIIVGLMAGLTDRPVRTFSIGFEEAAFNELGHARRVAERFGTQHEEHVVRPDALSILPTLVRHYGEPFADSSAIPTYYVSHLTRAGVTVALNGDGGDESFCGYERYLANRTAERLRALPGHRQAARLLIAGLPDSPDPRSRLRKIRRFLGVAHQEMPERYGRWVSYFRPEDKEALYGEALYGEALGTGSSGRPCAWMRGLFEATRGLDPAEAAMAVDVRSYLPGDLLVKVDITSMASGLEARSPFLDHEVMEFAARLPLAMKLRGRRAKNLLKRAFTDLLPAENARRRKMGFGVPVGQWFRGPLRELVHDTLLSERSEARGYFRPAELRRLVARHETGEGDHSFQIWCLLMLELWHREMVDGPAPRGAPAAVGAPA